MITVHMLIQNNQNNILKAINSILSIKPNFIFGDLGSTDDTVKICEKYGQVYKLKNKIELNKARNELLKYQGDWNIHLDPWEEIISGIHLLEQLKHKKYRFNIIQDKIITKPIRIWSKSEQIFYENPIFEAIKGEAEYLDMYVRRHITNDLENKIILLEKWKENHPLSHQYFYYKSYILLNQKRWKDFIDNANYFLFQENQNTMAAVMTKYHLSMIYCYVDKNYQESLKLIMECIAIKPLMAEFWCLLADIYYALNDFNKAKTLYENAKILGSRRLKKDEWPFDISKYIDHPNLMIESCDQLLSKINIYATSY